MLRVAAGSLTTSPSSASLMRIWQPSREVWVSPKARSSMSSSSSLAGASLSNQSCSTCHVVVEGPWFDKLAPASEDEEDMLDLAFGLTHTSRLGCQIRMTNELDGLVVKLPAATRNMMVDK